MSLFKKNNLLYVMPLSIYRNQAYSNKINTVWKRAEMLSKMVQDRDKRKSWHFEILQNHAKAKNVFEKVSRPSKRQNVLNVLFIQNITDVLSTGDAAPEIAGCGVEITGVKVSPCCQMVNVYWQLPPSKFSSDKDVAQILNNNASKIRAELISRNVMGRVPRIYFVQDTTNAYIAAFEKAMQEIDLGPDANSSVIPDDSFLENIYAFTDSKALKEEKKVKKVAIEATKTVPKSSDSAPARPHNMKCDVFGLDHDKLMSKVLALKIKPKFNPSSNVILTSIGDANADLFNKIPGTCFYEDTNRDELLKKFNIDRKKLRNKKAPVEEVDDTVYTDSFTGEYYMEPVAIKEDYIEEETVERF